MAIKILGLLPHTHQFEDHVIVHGVDYARTVNPLRYLDPEKFEVSILPTPFDIKTAIRDDVKKQYFRWSDMIRGYDIVYMPYLYGVDYFMNVGFNADKYGTKLVVDIDDNVWEVPVRSGAYSEMHPGSHALEVITKILQNVQFVTVSTTNVRYAVQKHANLPFSSMHTFKNYIDSSVYDYKKVQRVDDGSIRILYYGTNTHFDDLAANRGFVKAMDRLMVEFPQLQLFTVGFFLPEFKTRYKRQYFSLVGDQDVYSWAKELYVKATSMADIAVTPLLESNFTKCKSNIKYLECALAGLPVVSQNITQYQQVITNKTNGYLASTEQEWYEYLKGLIQSQELRKQIGSKGQSFVLDNYELKSHHEEFEQYFEEVDNKPVRRL